MTTDKTARALARAGERTARIAAATKRRANVACFQLYADEAATVPGASFKRFEFSIDDDLRGSFAGLLFEGASEATEVLQCRLGNQLAWSAPLSVGLFEALDWVSDAYPSPPIEPGMLIRVDVLGAFERLQFLVLKTPANAQ